MPGLWRGSHVGPGAVLAGNGRRPASPRRTLGHLAVGGEEGLDRGGRAVAMYVEGWMKADVDQIIAATDEDYRLDDPLLGEFSRRHLPQYFSLIAVRLRASGNISRRDLSFRLHGPMWSADGPDQMLYWREAPNLGLSGSTTIAANRSGVLGERVSYDLNMAAELLRGPYALNGDDNAI